MSLKIQVDYQVLQATRMLGLIDEFMDFINYMELGIEQASDARAFEGNKHIGRLCFKVRASIGERTGSIVMLVDRLG